MPVQASSLNHVSVAERLPVNPRRNKVPAASRKRVAKACNGCNVRRAKCSGSDPCDRCQKASRVCIFPAIEENVVIKRSEYEALLRSQAVNVRPHSEPSPGSDHASSLQGLRLQNILPAEQNGFESSDYSTHEPDTPREGRILQDPHGNVRYLGESSGATFLNHLREFMATVFPPAFNADHSALHSTDTRFIAALGRYQTHDSRPLLAESADPLLVPSKHEAQRMLTEFRLWTRDGLSTTASGGLYYWADVDALMTSYESYLYDTASTNDSRVLPLVNAVFAIACQLNPECAPSWDTGNGQTFFTRARSLIGNPLDVASLSDANVLTLLAFYLLNSNRRDASYMYTSIALHIYLVHGVHRAWSIDEDGKRKFWDAYNLDRWLSCTMGRPAIVADEAITLDAPRNSAGLPSADGLNAHIELSRIMHYIAANVYGVSKHSAEPRSTALCVHKALHMLKKWEHDLPTTLNCHPGKLDEDMVAYDLQMAANHLKLLAVRPWLFDSVKNETTSICLRGHRDSDILHREEIDLAIDAARQTIHLIRQLQHTKVQTHLMHTVIHHGFNAALALELHRILNSEDLVSDRDHISSITTLLSNQLGGNKPFAADCAVVLSDLACMVDKLREKASKSIGLPEYKTAAPEDHTWSMHL